MLVLVAGILTRSFVCVVIKGEEGVVCANEVHAGVFEINCEAVVEFEFEACILVSAVAGW